MPIDGTWYNELGSTLTIISSGTSISGTYQTAVGTSGSFNLTGYINNVNDDPYPSVGWVVLWTNGSVNKNSLTTWAGQYFEATTSPPAAEVIIAMWLLRSEGPQSANWTSTFVGEDVFYRSQEEAAGTGLTANLRRPAHPLD